MTGTTAAATFERRYQASVADLWDLWTTREGFESWWGPQGFRVAVHTIEPRVGGALVYDMIAVGAQEIEFMKQTFGGRTYHATRGTFQVVVPQQRLELAHLIDFVPGMAAYEHRMQVEFSSAGSEACMRIRAEPHTTPEWTRASVQGMESQLTKVPAALEARARR